MLKRFFLALAVSGGLLSPSFGAGTIPFSLTQQLDQFGTPLAGCQFYTIVAGTTSTPQSAYQDAGLSIALPNPQTCDASGRLPQMFLADGSIKVRLTDRNGVTQVAADNIQVIGNSSGGGGGSPVDPTTVLQTGWIVPIYGTGNVTGFVRSNGRTIGNAVSGASERANADTAALFSFLYNADANLVVAPGGRGVSAAADFAANKTITLPDWRGRALAGLDDMGNSAAGRLTATYFGATATVLGASGGVESRTLLAANLPPYTPAGSNAVTALAQATRQFSTAGSDDSNTLSRGNTGGNLVSPNGVPFVSGIVNFTGTAQGGTSTPFAVASPMMLATIYLKL